MHHHWYFWLIPAGGAAGWACLIWFFSPDWLLRRPLKAIRRKFKRTKKGQLLVLDTHRKRKAS
jgi:hypothetical protein